VAAVVTETGVRLPGQAEKPPIPIALAWTLRQEGRRAGFILLRPVGETHSQLQQFFAGQGLRFYRCSRLFIDSSSSERLAYLRTITLA